MTTLVGGGTFPIGGVLPFAGPTSEIPVGFLLCNGALLNRNDFAQLFAIIGTKWGTDSGVDFRLPTTQGLLLRGASNGAGGVYDPDAGSRNAIATGAATGDDVGSYQTGRLQSHFHDHLVTRSTVPSDVNSFNGGGASNAYNSVANKGIFGVGEPSNNAITPGGKTGVNWFNGNVADNDSDIHRSLRFRSQNSGGNQTVGPNVYMNFIIKFN